MVGCIFLEERYDIVILSFVFFFFWKNAKASSFVSRVMIRHQHSTSLYHGDGITIAPKINL